MSLKCFIASAFDKDDIDALYDEAIRPVTKSLGIVAWRVDRVQHNQDIDDKIMALMEESDLCIADLTYARPSVYFEAGHMSGSGKPVVFTCRSDHFRSKEDDVFGNLRVHFDLQMKNIIPWTAPNATFRRKLAARLRYVTAPMRRAQDAARRQSEQNWAFRLMSNEQKLRALLVVGADLIRRRRFSMPANGLISVADCYGTVGVKNIGNALSVAIVLPALSFTKKRIEGFEHLGWKVEHLELPTKHNLKKGHMRVIHLFCCSLRALRLTRIEEVYGYLKPYPDERRLIGGLRVSSGNWYYDVIDIHVIDNIVSEQDLAQRLGRALAAADATVRKWTTD